MNTFPLPAKYIFIVLLLFPITSLWSQAMLGYTDPHGDFYVQDNGRLVHLESQRVASYQFAANSLAYISSSGNLIYYFNHEQNKLDISNPTFYKNTDHYLFYSVGGGFSVFNGTERKYLGYILQDPYAFGDSIAGFHDYAEYFYAYYHDRFIEIEKNPVQKVIAGDNILAYINHLGQLKAYYNFESFDLDDYIPVKVECGANTIAYIDNYHYLKVFHKGINYELFNLTEINCLEIPGSLQDDGIEDYCNGELVYEVETGLPLFETGDDLVAYIDDTGRFQVFYDGNIIVLDQQPPLHYEVDDNMLWYIDNNNFLNVFTEGVLTNVETYYPETILSDKDVIVYTDLDKRLKAFYKGKKIAVSQNIILGFTLNNSMIMYTELPNKYQFFVLK